MIQKKICMVGPVSVGKTSLVARYVHSLFSDKYLSTVGVKIDKKTVQVGNTPVVLLLWDLAGDDDFQRLNLSYLRGASGYLLVADGSRYSTLVDAFEIQGRINALVGPTPFVLALNKADLVTEWEIPDTQIADLTSRGWGVFRTSAKDGVGVDAAFRELARRVVDSPAAKAGRATTP